VAILQTSTGNPDDRSDTAGAARKELRPSFVERDAFRTALSSAYADGRIDDEEFERRSTLIETGNHAADLQRALADLPRPEVEFPTTLTRAEALKRRRSLRTSGAPAVSRRLLLAGGAAALGFVVAGGASRLFGADSKAVETSGSDSPEVDFITDPAALEDVLTRVKDKGYTHFREISIDPDVFQAGARSLKSSRGIDSVIVYGRAEPDITPSSRLGEGDRLFTLDDFALGLIPAMAQAAAKKLGSRQGLRVELRTESDASNSKAEPVISVMVAGGDYGDGGGELRWTGDGAELISIRRTGDD